LASTTSLLHTLWRFRNNKIFRGGVVSPTLNPRPAGAGTTVPISPTL
jgi:hypothetical protein